MYSLIHGSCNIAVPLIISASAKDRQWEEMQHRQKQHHEVMFHADPRVQQSVRPPGNLEQHMLQSGFSMSDVKGEPPETIVPESSMRSDNRNGDYIERKSQQISNALIRRTLPKDLDQTRPCCRKVLHPGGNPYAQVP